MVEEETDEPMEDEDLEEMESKKKPVAKKPVSQQKAPQPSFNAYHLPQIDGLRNEKGEIITTDLWEAIALILNKLDAIHQEIAG